MTSRLVLSIEDSKKNAFLEMLKLFDFVQVEAVQASDIDMLEDHSAEFIADLQLEAKDKSTKDCISNEEAFKLFRQWAEE
jgi:hypothetical protein